MRYPKVIKVVCLFLVMAAASLAKAQVSEAELRRLAQPYVEAGEVVGMTIGVIHRDQQIIAGVGRFGQDGPRVPDGDTVYEIGSVTKVLTGVLLADAVERGQVSLDTTLKDLVVTADESVAGITLKQLSTHTSGLPRLPHNFKITDPANPYATYTHADLEACMKSVRLDHAPGSATAYSNLGSGLLGELLAEKARLPYAQLLAERIFKPLGMDDSAVDMTPAMRERAARPYAAGGVPAHHWDFPAMAGAGAVKSTVPDMLRLIEASLRPETAGALQGALERAWPEHKKPLSESDMAGGLGWFIAQDGQTRWHNGETGGFHSIVLVNRELDLGVIILANTATAEVDTLANEVFKAALGIPVTPRVFEKKVEVPTRLMDRLVGKYQLGERFTFTVVRHGQQLTVQLTGQQPLIVVPENPTLWKYRDIDDAAIRFDVDGNGRVTSLTLLQHGIEQTATRAKP